jgi:uncharacterized repeat protein (TIGR02543 family)
VKPSSTTTPTPGLIESLHLANLTAGTTYFVAVTAVDSESPALESACSGVVSAVARADTPSYLLTVRKLGTGSGTVTSAPAGINCGTACSASYPAPTSVTLTATPATGMTFTGWTDACSGTGACTVTMDAAKTATATFAPPGDTTPPGEPGPLQISAPTLLPNGAQYTISWAQSMDQPCNCPASAYPWRLGWNDGTHAQSGQVSTLNTIVVVPYPPAGTTMQWFACVRAKDAAGNLSLDPNGSCGGGVLPQAPVINPAPSPVTGVGVQ